MGRINKSTKTRRVRRFCGLWSNEENQGLCERRNQPATEMDYLFLRQAFSNILRRPTIRRARKRWRRDENRGRHKPCAVSPKSLFGYPYML